MLDRNQIVLITGAGASNALHPDFALGAGLLQQISDRVTDRTSIHEPYLSNLYKKLGFDYSICWDFVHHLDEYKKNAEYPSIDEFLNEVKSYPEFRNVRDKFIQIGKFAIMFQILGYESQLKNKLLKDNSWINEVARYIDKEKILEKKYGNEYPLKIITFNYDRTIEHFLYENHRFDNRKEEIKDFINKSVTHVYGKAGSLLWQDESPKFDFGENNNQADEIFNQKNEIDIMYFERSDRNSTYESNAQNWIHYGDNKSVCVFGFNFDLMNYRLLSLQNLGRQNQKVKFIANVYPHGDSTFNDRRKMASRIRNIKHDVEVTYLSCTEFINHVLYGQEY